MMRFLLATMLLAASPAALASGAGDAADTCPNVPAARACAWETYSGGKCSQPDTTERGWTILDVDVAGTQRVWASGSQHCTWSPTTYSEGGMILVGASVAGAHAEFVWARWHQRVNGQESGWCDLRTTVSAAGATNVGDWGCRAGGPPALGWGQLLP